MHGNSSIRRVAKAVALTAACFTLTLVPSFPASAASVTRPGPAVSAEPDRGDDSALPDSYWEGESDRSGPGVATWQYEASALAAPETPDFAAAIDDYASNDPQTRCLSEAQPGTVALRSIFNGAYGEHTGYILRDCGVGGTSEHKEGRALDYMLNVNDTDDRAVANSIINWMLATDRHGNKHANARRLGIMYMIWNRQIWSAARHSEGWRPYSGTSPHTDHIHFSQSWKGADKRTTWWTAALPPKPVVEIKMAPGRSYYGDDQHHVYALGANNTLKHFWYPEKNPGWSSATLTGSVTTEPVAYLAEGQHHVYGRNAAGQLQHWWYDTEWHTAVLGGSITGSPTAYYAAGQHHVYARTSTGSIIHWWYGDSWASDDLGGNITDSPTAYYAAGQHHVYVRSIGGSLYHFWYGATGWGSDNLNGGITGTPAAYYDGKSHHVYVRSPGGSEYHFWYGDSWASANIGSLS